MLNLKTLITCLIVTLFTAVGCSNKVDEKTENYLASWNEGSVKSSIINFVKDVTDKNSPNFVRPEDRIATFDNDGTLWSEQPMYFQLFFTIDRVKDLADKHPEWKETQPFKAVLENDMKTVLASGEHGLLELVMATHTGMTTDEFEKIIKEWVSTAKHPKFDLPFTDLVYQPMLELLDYLRANEFKTYIFSAGGIEFMRPLAEELYGISSEQVIGSSIKVKYEMSENGPVLKRLPEIDFINDKEGKPVGIHKFIGEKPIAAFGNSDGDLQMLQWTASNKNKSFMLFVHHTDDEREWAYDRKSSIGRFDKGLDEAIENGWTIVDMKKDWKVIYPFEL